jgi:hypothetical protein
LFVFGGSGGGGCGADDDDDDADAYAYAPFQPIHYPPTTQPKKGNRHHAD